LKDLSGKVPIAKVERCEKVLSAEIKARGRPNQDRKMIALKAVGPKQDKAKEAFPQFWDGAIKIETIYPSSKSRAGGKSIRKKKEVQWRGTRRRWEMLGDMRTISAGKIESPG